MLSATLLSLVVGIVQPAWHTSYDEAYVRAVKENKDLVIYFRGNDRLDDALVNPEVQKRLRQYVLLRVPASYEYKGKRLLNYDALDDMAGAAGLAVVSLHDEKLPTHNQVISAHPFVSSRYSWAPEYRAREVKLILDLPAEATLTQRSMIYAISVHPEQPRSVEGRGRGSGQRIGSGRGVVGQFRRRRDGAGSVVLVCRCLAALARPLGRGVAAPHIFRL
jgi:hypothetical protein